METVDELIAAIEARYGPLPSLYHRRLPEVGATALHPPVDVAAVAAAEKQLGLSLPPLLRAVYTRIGNGGWCLRLMGLDGGQTGFDDIGFRRKGLVAARRAMVRRWPQAFCKPWPENLVPISDASGCGMVEHVECGGDAGPVWRTDSGSLSVLYPTLREYLKDAIAR